MTQISVCEEYRGLVDKAYSKFSRLRDFPPYGQNKWGFYFHKAFQVYTRLWKYQQENRQKLVEAGLKRWEIGEIASRIGQLYYIYYLRTSDANFLKESYIFYDAILSREYFKDPGKDVSLANKQLRYLARFIVICLLLNRWDALLRLVKQLQILVDDFSSSFQNVHTNDAKEWKVVAQEIVRFLKFTSSREVGRPFRYVLLLDGQPSSFPSVLKLEGRKSLKLQNSVLVSYYPGETRFNELTVDNFRMLQCLEWEPSGSYYHLKSSDRNNGVARDIVDPSLPPNPHKYILYRPSIQQFLLVLATACEELPTDSIILLYISASGKQRGPVLSTKGASILSSSSISSSPDHGEASPDRLESPGKTTKEASGLWLGRRDNYIYPSDLLPFTRKPLFLVIDSDNSSLFEALIGDERGEAACLLLSPTSCPSSVKQNGGNLFTFFLSGPVQAFCQMVGLSMSDLPQDTYEQAEKLLSSLFTEWGDSLASSPSINIVWARVLNDPFLRQFILRFIFARACYSFHDLYMVRKDYIPKCLPSLPDEVLPGSKLVEAGIFGFAKTLDTMNCFASFHFHL